MRRLVPELLLGAGLLWSGCPSSLSPFEGAWTVTDGGTTLVCDGGTTTTPVVGPIVIIDDGHSGLYVSMSGMTETFAITGKTANSFAQKLSPTDDAGFETGSTISLIGDALSLSGNTLIESASGSEEQADGGTCSFSRALTATRDPP
jgi:hypothetical protein